MVGDECFVGEHAVINPGVKVYPFKTVEAGAVVNSSIVWESRGARTVFGRRGIRGLANVDITPEVVVRVAMAYGTSLPRGSVVTASRDTSRIARALKRAIIGGLNLAGVERRGPRARHGAAHPLPGPQQPGARRRLGPARARGPGQRRDPFLRRRRPRHRRRRPAARSSGCCTARTTGVPSPATSATSRSRRGRSSSTRPGSARSVDEDRIREYGFKVVLDYSNGAASIVMPTVLRACSESTCSRSTRTRAPSRRRRSRRPTSARRASVSSSARPAATSACSSTPTGSSPRSSTTKARS